MRSLEMTFVPFVIGSGGIWSLSLWLSPRDDVGNLVVEARYFLASKSCSHVDLRLLLNDVVPNQNDENKADDYENCNDLSLKDHNHEAVDRWLPGQVAQKGHIAEERALCRINTETGILNCYCGRVLACDRWEERSKNEEE